MTYWRFILCTLVFCYEAHTQHIGVARIRSLLPQSVAFKLLLLKPPASRGSLFPQGRNPARRQVGSSSGGPFIPSDPIGGPGFVHPLLDPNYGNSHNGFNGFGGYSETISPTGYPGDMSGSGTFGGPSPGSPGFSGGSPLGLLGVDSTGFPGNLMGSGGLLGGMSSTGNKETGFPGLHLEQTSGGFGQGPVGDFFASGQNGGLLGLDVMPGSLTGGFPGGAPSLLGHSEGSQGFGMSMGLPGELPGTEQQSLNKGMAVNILRETSPTSTPQMAKVAPTNPGQSFTSGPVTSPVNRSKIQKNIQNPPRPKVQQRLQNSRQTGAGKGPIRRIPESAVGGINRPASIRGVQPIIPPIIPSGVPPVIRPGTVLPPSALLPTGGVVLRVDGSDAVVASPDGVETTVDGTDFSQEVVV
ncbi:collagen, type I, alpha 1b-like [Haliotis cracherodii]|uniref:collagen, type I, alpha 1b-like n=1 Tax=Haliotis cracherodii TaxID=6455 RepID=UPI0039EA8DEE